LWVTDTHGLLAIMSHIANLNLALILAVMISGKSVVLPRGAVLRVPA
jgi:hypothetical protein